MTRQDISKLRPAKCVFLKSSLEIAFLDVILQALVVNLFYRSYFSDIPLDGSHILITLIPLVITVLSITLSLPKETIYGVDKNEFRKLRGGRTYGFLDMLTIAVFLVAAYSAALAFEAFLVVWVLDAISVVYSVLFVAQEIPLLTQDDKAIRKIIKKSFSAETKDPSLEDAVEYLLLTSDSDKGFGIVPAYELLKTGDEQKNRLVLDRLLGSQNQYLRKYIENKDLLLKGASAEYKHIAVVDAIDAAFGNIKDVLRFDDRLNIVKVFGDEGPVYQITRSLISLHKILGEPSSREKSDKCFGDTVGYALESIQNGKKSEPTERFLYRTLNAMLAYTLPEGNMWFVECLRDSSYRDSYSIDGPDEYMVFASLYLHQLSNIEGQVSANAKANIDKFLKERSCVFGLRGDPWLETLRHRLDGMGVEDIEGLLPKLLSIYRASGDVLDWLVLQSSGEETFSLSSEVPFSEELLMNWWVGFALTNEELDSWLYNNDVAFSLPSLGAKDSSLLAAELNKNWFQEDKLRVDVTLPASAFFGGPAAVEPYLRDSRIASALHDFMDAKIKAEIDEELNANQKPDDKLLSYKKTLEEGFDKAVSAFPLLDHSVAVDSEPTLFYDYLFDVKWSDGLVKANADRMSMSLAALIGHDFSEKSQVQKKTISDYDAISLNNIIAFAPFRRSGIVYSSSLTSAAELKQIDAINKIPDIGQPGLPRGLFIKAGAIKMNFQRVREKDESRRLTSDEASNIADRDYKLANGLYKYIDSDSSRGERSVLMTKDEIMDVISKTLFLARIAFQYKIVYQPENILHYFRDVAKT